MFPIIITAVIVAAFIAGSAAFAAYALHSERMTLDEVAQLAHWYVNGVQGIGRREVRQAIEAQGADAWTKLVNAARAAA